MENKKVQVVHLQMVKDDEIILGDRGEFYSQQEDSIKN